MNSKRFSYCRTWASLGLGCVLGSCAAGTREKPEYPALTFPTSLGERPSSSHKPTRTTQNPASASNESPHAQPTETSGEAHAHGFAPDPTPLWTVDYWRLVFRHERRQIELVDFKAVRFDKPTATPRCIGRFALELWIGHELIDRVRFDFPLLAVEAPVAEQRRGAPLNEPPNFAEGAVVEQTVWLPDSPRATRLELVDRATGHVQALPWPLGESTPDAARPRSGDGSDAGKL